MHMGVIGGVVALILVKFYLVGSMPETPAIPQETEETSFSAAEVIVSDTYRYDAPPSITKEAYQSIMCEKSQGVCAEAAEMYDILIEAGIDPVVEAAQADHETQRGSSGVGRSHIKNLHGVQCHSDDGRIGDSPVPWGNHCAGIYASYSDSVRTWARLILREYVNEGLNTPALAVGKYAPVDDGNSPPDYIQAMETNIDTWRQQYAPTQAAETPTTEASSVRAALVAQALALQGIPYVRGGRSADGGDCSGTMQYIYKTVVAIDIGGTTFSQQDNTELRPITEAELRPGDLWYGHYSNDQHTGMVADVDNDGHWDLINNGGLASNMHVDYNFLAIPYFYEHTMGYRNALGD